jgi:signal transduction histidine kinase
MLWFCRFRWIVIGTLAAFGILGLVPELLPRFGLRPGTMWAFVIAAMLTLENIGFLAHARFVTRSPTSREAKRNLWGQIIVDLVILTVVVHFVGSLETPVAFAYLFHIVLACIFFSRPESLLVTVMAGALYVSCVWAEAVGISPAAGIYSDTLLRERLAGAPGMTVLHVASALVIWLVVWYLASLLSVMVRERDHELAKTNRRLEEAQEQRMRHMLRTTHELKAPFAAIHANTQLLLKGYCGVLPDEAMPIVERIAQRCRRLADEIQEMLQLANLRTAMASSSDWVELDLREVLQWCIRQVAALAQERRVVIEDELESEKVVAVEDQMKMLFSNVVSNAVTYSYEGGRVRVECRSAPGGGPMVTIEDRGLGIPSEKLPRIFDEYYRTAEAVAHNRESTGLGLAIVRQVARRHGIRVQVESAPGVGTKFVLSFPPAEPGANAEKGRKEAEDGLHNDS